MYKYMSFNVNFTLFVSYILTSSTFRSVMIMGLHSLDICMPLDERLPHSMKYEYVSIITNDNLHMRSNNDPNIQKFVRCRCQCIFPHQYEAYSEVSKMYRRCLRKCTLKKRKHINIFYKNIIRISKIFYKIK